MLFFNPSKIDEICSDDNEFKQQIIKTYNEVTLDSIEKIKNAVINEQIDDIKFHAHKLKSSFDFLGAKSLSYKCMRIESNCINKTLTPNNKTEINDFIILLEDSIYEINSLINQ